MSMWQLNTDMLEESKSPRDIVQEECEELAKLTQKKVFARITSYDGEYINRPSLTKYDSVFKELVVTPGFDVQSVLGENASDSENTFVYEMYLTSEKTPKYKYRVFFMYYGIELYPANLIIPREISEELKLKSDKITVVTEQDFRETLRSILGSKKVTSVLYKLLNLNR